jgi:PPOX class probable FMN-dependent enzyme
MNTQQAPFSDFEDVVGSLDNIREHIREPVPQIIAKVMDHIDEISRKYIEKSPFVVLASASSEGYPDISPKGDPAGFIKVLNEKYLAIPDRPGNRRVDTFKNILQNPYLAIIFLIPGKGETLRITGECRIVRDRALRESMAIKGRIPEFAIVVHVERVLIHCPKCIIRANLWQPDAWPDSSDMADIGEAMIAHAHLDTTPEELQAVAEKEGLTDLY